MTHTPGPWIADGAQVHRPGFGCIAECGFGAGRYEECAANARLIAAALDMLLALRACELMVSQDAAPPDWDWIREVLAKAEGNDR